MAQQKKRSTRSRQPVTPTPTNKDDVIRFRVTAEQKEGLEAAAARDGLNLSNWIRRLALREAGLLPQ